MPSAFMASRTSSAVALSLVKVLVAPSSRSTNVFTESVSVMTTMSTSPVSMTSPRSLMSPRSTLAAEAGDNAAAGGADNGTADQ